ncbi:MAG: prolipoprotein diacylglyceryl transferase [Actinobacteria bacterium]|nr:prolipoprotein diacylglyceryl transferase [Actinomycetota bacterium]
MTAAVIRIGIDPFIHLGPLTLAWHGLTIAIGIILGGVLAGRVVRELGMPTDPLWTIGAILALAALVGGKIFFLAEHGELTQPGRWLSGNGFTFDGGFIAAAVGIAVYVWRSRLPLSYLDAVAVALPFRRRGRARRGRHQRRAPRAGQHLLPRRPEHEPRRRCAEQRHRLSLGRPVRGAARQRDLRDRLAEPAAAHGTAAARGLHRARAVLRGTLCDVLRALRQPGRRARTEQHAMDESGAAGDRADRTGADTEREFTRAPSARRYVIRPEPTERPTQVTHPSNRLEQTGHHGDPTSRRDTQDRLRGSPRAVRHPILLPFPAVARHSRISPGLPGGNGGPTLMGRTGRQRPACTS